MTESWDTEVTATAELIARHMEIMEAAHAVTDDLISAMRARRFDSIDEKTEHRKLICARLASSTQDVNKAVAALEKSRATRGIVSDPSLASLHKVLESVRKLRHSLAWKQSQCVRHLKRDLDQCAEQVANLRKTKATMGLYKSTATATVPRFLDSRR